MDRQLHPRRARYVGRAGTVAPGRRRLKKSALRAVLAASLAGLAPLPGYSEDIAQSKGDRILALQVTEAADNDFDRAFVTAAATGFQAVELPVFWDDVETRPGVFNPDPNFLKIANAAYPPRNTSVILVLPLIDTMQERVPADLAEIALDDPVFVQRFNHFQDYVFSQIPDLPLVCLSIGNEVDVFLGGNEALWKQFESFFRQVAAHARAKRPGLKVGVKATFDGLTGAHRDALKSLNRDTDAVMATYYPLGPGFTVKNPAIVGLDMDLLTAYFPKREIHLLEVGYPSAPRLGSSEEKQARFVSSFFLAWDAHMDQIKVVNLNRSTDLSQAVVDAMIDGGYYGQGGEPIKEFIRTLGLRTHKGHGRDKQAFRTLVQETAARDW